MTALEIVPPTPTIGAELRGVRLSADLDAAVIAEIRQALMDHLVVFFPNQDLTAEAQLGFAERFGPALIPTIGSASPELPAITLLDQVAPKGQLTDRWHTDHTFIEEPPMGSMLHALQLPSSGGDTCFASMYAAYDTLSDDMKRLLDPLQALHTSEMVAREIRFLSNVVVGTPHYEPREAIHPVVRVHPETGRKLLFVCGNFTSRIVGLSEAESDAILGFLFEHIKTPAFQCRYTWQPGAVAFWDNRSAQHCAIPDYVERRVMQRVMVAGDAPYGPSDLD